jgi:methylmalonyl-CoA mutase
VTSVELIRSTDEEKAKQIDAVGAFQLARNRGIDGKPRPETSPGSLHTLQRIAREGKNVFGSLMESVKYYSLGQITHALYQVGGEYRRNM